MLARLLWLSADSYLACSILWLRVVRAGFRCYSSQDLQLFSVQVPPHILTSRQPSQACICCGFFLLLVFVHPEFATQPATERAAFLDYCTRSKRRLRTYPCAGPYVTLSTWDYRNMYRLPEGDVTWH